jgi:hypothetical protein
MDMVTNTRLLLELEAERPQVAHDWLSQFIQRASKRAGQLRCGLTGHNVLMRYQPTKLSLQCATCGYESPGWEIERNRAVPSAAPVFQPQAVGDAERPLRAHIASRIGPPVAA